MKISEKLSQKISAYVLLGFLIT